MKNKPAAVFTGCAEQLKIAYPDYLREEITRAADILHDGFPGPGWREHTAVLEKAEILFGTWGVPVLDDEFLQAAPCLKAVFYAAGTVKGFALPAAYKRGTRISSAWAANAIPVSEYTLAVISLSLKNFWSLAK